MKIKTIVKINNLKVDSRKFGELKIQSNLEKHNYNLFWENEQNNYILKFKKMI
ncbi:Uncharacterised protein [Staphylococcus epidermidis]|nr:Uncharacterised protein [Staphylococcus epidermidis]SUM53524.1 Uncharacterised protein [Staphylococcus epidermidis]